MEAAFVRRVVRGWAISLALLGAACGPGLPEDVARAEQAVTGIARGALSLPWQGTVSTSFAAGALNSDHTVVVRFMAQYEASLEGPLVADGSGNYVIGMADFNSIGNEGTLIRVGGIQQIYAIPDPVRWTDFGDLSPGTATCPGASWCPVPPAPNARWRTLVVVRSGASISVYRDGVLAGTQLAGVAVASGTLQLGRRPVGAGERKNQFFGLLDDVGVFNRALSAAEVVALSAASALSGTEAGLVAGWSFDDDATEPPVLRQPFTLQGPASVVPISAGRDAAADTARLPPALNVTPMSLPFPAGDVWLVIQSINSFKGSHRGFANYCWDLIFVEPSLVASNPTGIPVLTQADSLNKRHEASGPGTVANIQESSPLGNSELTNFVSVQHSPEEISSYLHINQNSASAHGTVIGGAVARGQVLANVGDTGAAPGAYHIHYAVTDFAEGLGAPLVTYPVFFHDYFASSNYGATWQFVPQGIPRPGQWISKTNPRDAEACLLGTNHVRIADRTTAAARVASPGGFELGVSAHVTGDVTVGGALLGSHALVTGNLTVAGAATLGAGVTVTGTLLTNTPIASPSLPARVVTPGTAPVEVPNGATRTVAPGAYGAAVFRAGSVVTLGAGTYRFASLTVETDVRLVVASGPVQVDVQGAFAFGDRARVQAGDAASLVVYANGGDLRIGTDADYRAITIAPNARVTVSSRTHVMGCVGARDLDLEPDVVLDSASLFLPPGGPPSCSDGVQNGSEAGIDCGGGCATACPTVNMRATLTLTSDWGGGYCATLNVINQAGVAANSWVVRLNSNQSQLSSSWNAGFSGVAGAIAVTPLSWNAHIDPGGTNSSVGFCANRTGGSSSGVATIVSATGAP